jgi:CRISPR-associated protein Cmr6
MRRFVRALAGELDQQTKKRPDDRRGQWAGEGQHAGLLLQRYLCEHTTGEEANPEEKRAILGAAMQAADDEDLRTLYSAAFKRWSDSLSTNAARVDLVTAGRMIVGLGSENVLETGIRLHQTYGLPIIPGSALKGLAAHYCDQVWGMRRAEAPSEDAIRFRGGRQSDKEHNHPEEAPGDYHQLLFGATDDSGCIIFHDAWMRPDSTAPLVLDVTTPHHPKWLDGSVPPTDFDSPIPVPFLSVRGQFHLVLSWCGPDADQTKGKNWTTLAIELLKEALSEWGIGGKTSSGYGRLVVPPPPPPPAKRASGTTAKVAIISARAKGGFNVQDFETGRKSGTLTLGSAPSGIDTKPGSVVNVLVHNDDATRPQYKWPPPNVPKKK